MLTTTKDKVQALAFDFLGSGMQWPPPSEVERLERYAANKLLFENKHEVQFKENLKRIQRVIGNFDEVVSYTVNMNYFRKISLKTADLLLGEPPKIKAENENKNEQQTIDDFIKESDLYKKDYMLAIDVSRYGVGIFYPHRNTEGKVYIDTVTPSVWFPIYNVDNVQECFCHVLAWDYAEYQNPGDKTSKADYFLKVQIHVPGKYIERLYKLSDIKPPIKTITGMISESVHATKLKDMPIVPIVNVATSDNQLGYDDYEDVQSIICELEIRVAQIAKILDQHAAPTLAAPRLAIEQDANGRYYYKSGKVIPMFEGVPVPQYITWDGQLEAAFRHIEILMQALYYLSEMGPAVWGDAEKLGNVPSGTALRRMMMPTLAKVNRVRSNFDTGVKKALMIAAELQGTPLSGVSITWQDGLPADEMENANIINLRTGGKATMSRQTAIERYDGATASATENEIEKIDEDEAMSNQLVPPVFGN